MHQKKKIGHYLGVEKAAMPARPDTDEKEGRRVRRLLPARKELD